MEVLLCAATTFEIQPTIDFIRQHALQEKVAVLVTGVGLVAATYALTRSITGNKPALVLQGGIAGSFSKSLPLGSAVTVAQEALAEFGVEETGQFRSVFDLNLVQANAHPWTNGTLINPNAQLLQSFGLPVVDGLSVQEISTDPARIERLTCMSGASIETMEGAALHYVALREGVDFAQVRTISNVVGERDKKAWKLKESIECLNAHLQHFLINKLKS